MADLSKVKIGEVVYTLKDAAGRGLIDANTTAIATEKSRAEGAEGGLDTRIKALESKGRYLSTWDATTGLPETYPEVSGDYPKKYDYRSGDYYIVNKVAASGSKNYMPDGASITKQDAASSWVVGKAEYTGTLNLGDQFQYDGTKWTHIASATTVAFANIQGDAEENTNLKGKLDAKLAHKSGKSGSAGDLAYKDSASASYTPAGTISEVDATPAGEITLNAFTQTATAATISAKADYTPAGEVAGTVVPTGTVATTVATADATAVIDAEAYTPAGSVTGKVTATGTVAGKVTATGTVATTVATADAAAVVAADDYTPEGTVAVSLSNGAISDLMDSVGTQASYEHTGFDGGSFSKGSAVTAATEGLTAHLATGEEIKGDVDAETLIFVAAATDNVMDYEASFTAATYGTDNFVTNTLPTKKSQTVGVASATFTGTLAEDIKVTGVTYKKSGEATSTFTGNASGDAITATFTGNALGDAITASFAGTEAADMKVKSVTYKKSGNATSTFTGNASGDVITATFTGAKSEQLIPTGVTYDKATANGASFSGTTNKITPTFSGTAATITVE